MKRLFVAAVAATSVAGCVTVPGSEREVASWNNGVAMTQRAVTFWYGASPTERQEAWGKNSSSSAQCLALKASNTSGYARTWLLRPGTNEPMFPEMSEYNSTRYVPGQYGSWTPRDGASCDTPPANLALQRVGETVY